MAQRVVSVTINLVAPPLNYLGPGQSVNLVATVVTAGSGPPIDTSVSWVYANSTGPQTATFTAPPDTEPQEWTTNHGCAFIPVQAIANWQSSSVVDVSGTAVSWDSGNDFSAWSVGASVAINGQIFGIAGVSSTTSATLSASAGTLSGVSAVLFIIRGYMPIPVGPVIVNLIAPPQMVYPGYPYPMAPLLCVLGATNPAVTWTCNVGSIDSSGNYTAVSPSSSGLFIDLVTAFGGRSGTILDGCGLHL